MRVLFCLLLEEGSKPRWSYKIGLVHGRNTPFRDQQK
jgi:hypothetical protein